MLQSAKGEAVSAVERLVEDAPDRELCQDLAELLERFQERGVALVSVAEFLDSGSAAGRLFRPNPLIRLARSDRQWKL